ncbi:hypothetical protein C1645_828465 [Glomus cerebriforme]|uniref:Uncharacterized protein n=1 Tax=Glomus cerebriforme TaxID=658196 RepID=A0A397SPX1_9GLOM|nr:hypothetical protein C1645_828465 [Glomus cerebriforme]
MNLLFYIFKQEAFHSKTYNFNIPDNVDDFNKSSNQNTSKTSGILKAFDKLQINSNNEEIYDDKNFHSEEQGEYEIPDDGF